MTKHSLLALFLFGASAWAQPFSAGVKVGLPLTNFIDTVSGQSSTVTNRYLVGPTAELHLPFGLGIEVDALYRHFNYQDILGTGVNAVTSANTAGAWEFPVLLKYRFPGKLARPYLDAGVAWDKITGLSNTIKSSLSTGTVANPSGETNSSTTGFVIGAGLDLHFVIHVLPELRYTRGGRGPNLLAQREVDVDHGLHLHGLSVQQGRTIDPRLHRFQRRRDQQRMSADQLQARDVSFLVDHRAHAHHALNPRCLRVGRIDGRRLANQVLRLYASANAYARRRT